MKSNEKKSLSIHSGESIDRFQDKVKTIFSKLEANRKGKTVLYESPPDEASEALGYQLANELLSFLPTSPDDDKHQGEFGIGGMAILNRLLSLNDNCKVLNTSVSHSYFNLLGESLSSSIMRYDGVLMLSMWSSWIENCENIIIEKNHPSPAVVILGLLVHHYAQLLYGQVAMSQKSMSGQNKTAPSLQEKYSDLISHTFLQFRLIETKKCLIREFTSMISTHGQKSSDKNNKMRHLMIFLSPIASSSLLIKTSSDSSEELSNLFLQCFMREFRSCLSSEDKCMLYPPNEWFHLFQWMTKILHILVSSFTRDSLVLSSTLELGHQFLIDLCDLINTFLKKISDKGEIIEGESSSIISNTIECILDKILPSFIHIVPHCNLLPIETIMFQLHSTVSLSRILQPSKRIIVSEITLFHLCALSLHTPKNTSHLLKILESLLCVVDQSNEDNNIPMENYNSILIGSIFSIGCIFSYPSNRHTEARNLRLHAINAIITKRNNCTHSTAASKKLEPPTKTKSENFDYGHIFQLFRDSRAHDEKVQILNFLSSIPLNQPCLSVTEQCELLLFSLSLLVDSKIAMHNVDGDDFAKLAFNFLGRVLSEYVHLGIRTLPVVMVLMKISLDQNDYDYVALALEFLASSTSHDPHCAHEFWNTLSSLTTAHIPVNVQSMVLRMYPLLCSSNKRLISRVMNSLGTYILHPNAELRLTASITLCDLAKNDSIRDVSAIIGWIQSLLVDEEEMVVHFAVLTLHYLVLNGELDFAIVVKVINKKLANVSDFQSILELRPTVMEALVIFLGDGEVSIVTNSEDESEGEELRISPQTKYSVETLIQLALFPWFENIHDSHDQAHDFDSKLIIVETIYSSLSNYSVAFLGLDQDSIRSSLKADVVQDDNDVSCDDGGDIIRYKMLKRAVKQGLIMQEKILASKQNGSNKMLSSVQKLARSIVLLEEQALGPSLWVIKKGVGNRNSMTSNHFHLKPSKVSKSTLPTYTEMHNYYLEDPSDVTAISSFLCFRQENNRTDVDIFSLLNDISDMVNDMKYLSDEPFIRVLSYQSIINSMREVLRIISVEESKSDIEPLDIVKKILEWRGMLEIPDVIYIVLGAFLLVLPDAIHCSNTNDLIYSTVMDAHEERIIEDENLECAAVGFIALKLIQSSSLSGVQNIIDFLESVSKRGIDNGNSTFEASFCLGFIAQSLYEYSCISASTESISCSTAHIMIQQILSAIFIEIYSFLNGDIFVLSSFITCLKVGVLTPNLMNDFGSMATDLLHVQEGSKEKFKASCISLTFAMPGLLHLDADFIKATYYVLLNLPWGFGKGLPLAAVIDLMSNTGMLNTDILDQIYEHCLSGFTRAADGAPYDDVFFVFAKIAELYHISYDDPENSWFYRIFHPHQEDNFNSGTTATAILAMSLAIGSVPAFSGTTVLFSQNSFLNSSTTRKKVEFFVKKLKSIAKNWENNENVRNSAILCLGIMSSMRYDVCDDNFLSLKKKSSILSSSNSNLDRNSTNYDKGHLFPDATVGSLLHFILNQCSRKVDEIHSQRSSYIHTSTLAQCLSCIKEVAIPAAITECVDLLVRWESDVKNSYKEVCIEFIVMQASMMRRATSERQDYIKYYASLSKESPDTFSSIIGNASHVLLSKFSDVVPFLTSKNAIELIDRFWILSCSKGLHEPKVAASIFKSFKEILHCVSKKTKLDKKQKFSTKIPPAVIGRIQSLILNESFDFMGRSIEFMVDEAPLTNYESILDLWAQYLDCVAEIPFDIFKRDNFFSFQTENINENVARVFVISFISKQDSLSGKMEQEITKSIAWIARQSLVYPIESNGSNHTRLWLASFSLSIPNNKLPSEWKKDMISNFFESVLVNGIDSQRLNHFATEIIYFLSSQRQKFGNNINMRMEMFHSLFSILSISVNNLPSFFLLPKHFWNDVSILAVNDLPKHLGLLCLHYSMNSAVMNKVFRILRNAKHQEALNGTVQFECLEKIVLACVERGHCSINNYATFANSLLTTF